MEEAQRLARVWEAGENQRYLQYLLLMSLIWTATFFEVILFLVKEPGFWVRYWFFFYGFRWLVGQNELLIVSYCRIRFSIRSGASLLVCGGNRSFWLDFCAMCWLRFCRGCPWYLIDFHAAWTIALGSKGLLQGEEAREVWISRVFCEMERLVLSRFQRLQSVGIDRFSQTTGWVWFLFALAEFFWLRRRLCLPNNFKSDRFGCSSSALCYVGTYSPNIFRGLWFSLSLSFNVYRRTCFGLLRIWVYGCHGFMGFSALFFHGARIYTLLLLIFLV